VAPRLGAGLDDGGEPAGAFLPDVPRGGSMSVLSNIYQGRSNAVAACFECGARIVAPTAKDVMEAAERARWSANRCGRCNWKATVKTQGKKWPS
jgi:DNA-directed RNA polymerase subunit RPC12/RpoP